MSKKKPPPKKQLPDPPFPDERTAIIEDLAAGIRNGPEAPDYHKEFWYWLEEHDKCLELERKAHGKEARQPLVDRMIVAYKMLCWSFDIRLCGKSDCTIPPPGRRRYCCDAHREQQKARRQRKRYPERAEEAKRKYYTSGG